MAAFEATAFVKYDGYAGALSVHGVVGPMTTSGGSQTFDYHLYDVDPDCINGAGPAGNSCGIHIHAGMSCTENAGGHYYNDAQFTSTTDPWKLVSYTAYNTTVGGVAIGTSTVTTGLTSADVSGRTFIVHDYQGATIACAVLGAV